MTEPDYPFLSVTECINFWIGIIDFSFVWSLHIKIIFVSKSIFNSAFIVFGKLGKCNFLKMKFEGSLL